MNLIFNASAGTGKTWQVTELYTALVLGSAHEHLPENRAPVPAEQLLLMTFTDNAAAELRARVARKLLAAETGALNSGDDETAAIARRALRSMPAANISTIHAFCAGLLREFALDAGLSPDFQTLDDDARDVLLNDVLRRTIIQALETDANFRTFCAGLSVLGDFDSSVIKTMRALLEKAASRGLDLSDAGALLPPPEHTVDRIHFEKIYDELCALGTTTKTGMEAEIRLKAAVDHFPNVKMIAQLPKFGRVNKALSDELSALKKQFLAEFFYAQEFDMFKAFAQCLSTASQEFTAVKRARDAVDFDDQLLLVRDLLKRNPDGVSFDWIIVDEVQDTSRVQFEIIKALWRAETNLVICGDRKQSIYAWRSADPDVMPDIEKLMAARGGLKQVALKKSFRSKDRVLTAVNELFAGLYPDYHNAALEPAPELNALTESGKGACVEFLAPDSEDCSTDEEMAAVARRIKLLVHENAWCPEFGYDEQAKRFVEKAPVQYGDILILLRRAKYQTILEQALRKADIPYTSGGKGAALFKQQEVRDMLLFLQTLCEPENDLALVGTMRSPFAGLSDEQIVAFGWNGETFDREILRRNFFESGVPAAERILRYRKLIGEKTASALVRDAVRETAFDAVLAGNSNGGQSLANFKKALDWLRTAERGGQTLLPDVVRRFEKAIKTPPRGSAAEALLPDREQNAVTIMTAHGAKGLTKRVCFVPDISFGDMSNTFFAQFTDAGKLEMNITGISGAKMETPGWDAARTADKDVRQLEQTNVFYVAMTRARDLIVFSGAGTSKPTGWLKQSEQFISNAGTDILKIRKFSEIPEIEFRAQDSGLRVEDVKFVPLKVPAGVERKTVTELVKIEKEKDHPLAAYYPPLKNPALFGTLGHTVLEELAKNNWNGEIPALVKLFEAETGAVETELLIPQLEATRKFLRTATAGATQLFVEYPFVLKHDDFIIDGTIDLLVRFPAGWKIFDYKFSGESPENARKIYAPQLNTYQDAVKKLHDGAPVSATLILIRDTVETVEL
ncbi:MAG: UvrD-helicase domain-containing protein [Kiritimatiellales bacterium]